MRCAYQAYPQPARRPDKAQPHPAISLLRLLKIVAKRRKHPLPFRRFSLN